MAKLDTAAALRLGAEKGPYDKLPILRFEEAARVDFLAWRMDLERRLRSGEMSPALEGHLAKYRKLVPSLALINHSQTGARGRFPTVRCLRRWRPPITWKATHGASTAQARRASWRRPRRS